MSEIPKKWKKNKIILSSGDSGPRYAYIAKIRYP